MLGFLSAPARALQKKSPSIQFGIEGDRSLNNPPQRNGPSKPHWT